jgi:TPR repeat protein
VAQSRFLRNPWGRFALAEALEKGDGTPANVNEALHLYRSVAAQDREPKAKRLAANAITRLKGFLPTE